MCPISTTRYDVSLESTVVFLQFFGTAANEISEALHSDAVLKMRQGMSGGRDGVSA